VEDVRGVPAHVVQAPDVRRAVDESLRAQGGETVRQPLEVQKVAAFAADSETAARRAPGETHHTATDEPVPPRTTTVFMPPPPNRCGWSPLQAGRTTPGIGRPHRPRTLPGSPLSITGMRAVVLQKMDLVDRMTRAHFRDDAHLPLGEQVAGTTQRLR